jgi:hypothetical protein
LVCVLRDQQRAWIRGGERGACAAGRASKNKGFDELDQGLFLLR